MIISRAPNTQKGIELYICGSSPNHPTKLKKWPFSQKKGIFWNLHTLLCQQNNSKLKVRMPPIKASKTRKSPRRKVKTAIVYLVETFVQVMPCSMSWKWTLRFFSYQGTYVTPRSVTEIWRVDLRYFFWFVLCLTYNRISFTHYNIEPASPLDYFY